MTCLVLGVGLRWGHEEAPPSRGCGVVGLLWGGLGAGGVDHCPALGALPEPGVVLPAPSGAVDEYVGGGLQSGVCTLTHGFLVLAGMGFLLARWEVAASCRAALCGLFDVGVVLFWGLCWVVVTQGSASGG